MFLLNNDEKISFLKVVYSVIMFDDHIEKEERVILESLQNEIFNLNSFQKINLETEENIANEINKIKKVTPVIHLFNILYDLNIYYKKVRISSNQNEKSKYKEEYNHKITLLLDRVTYSDEIKKSKFFDDSFIKVKEDKPVKKYKNKIEESINEQLLISSEILVKSTKNIFGKLFK